MESQAVLLLFFAMLENFGYALGVETTEAAAKGNIPHPATTSLWECSGCCLFFEARRDTGAWTSKPW